MKNIISRKKDLVSDLSRTPIYEIWSDFYLAPKSDCGLIVSRTPIYEICPISIPIFNSNFQFQFSIFQFSIFQFSILQFSILQIFNLHFFKRPSQNDHLNTIISILPSQNDHHNTTIPMVPNSISNSNFNLPFFSTQLSFTCTWKHDLLMVRLIIYLSSNKVHIINHHS